VAIFSNNLYSTWTNIKFNKFQTRCVLKYLTIFAHLPTVQTYSLFTDFLVQRFDSANFCLHSARISKQYFCLPLIPNHFCLPTRNYCCLFVYYFHMHNYWYNFNLIAIKFLRNLRWTTQTTKSVRANYEYILRGFLLAILFICFFLVLAEDGVPQINMFEPLPSEVPCQCL